MGVEVCPYSVKTISFVSSDKNTVSKSFGTKIGNWLDIGLGQSSARAKPSSNLMRITYQEAIPVSAEEGAGPAPAEECCHEGSW